MVRLYLSDAMESFITSKFFVNLDGPVGTGQINKREDVMYVQFLLHVTRGDWRGINATVKRDGQFGPETKQGILNFQQNINSMFGRTLQEDNIVHPVRAPGTNIRSSTLGWLTQLYFSKNRDSYPDFRGHVDWPGLSPLGILLSM